MKYTIECSIFIGTQVEVTKKTMAEVTRLPRTRERWYIRRALYPEISRQFLKLGEYLVKKGKEFDHQSLPHPWEDTIVFIQCYFTCKRNYDTIYVQHILLLKHLFHNPHINILYFIFRKLQIVTYPTTPSLDYATATKTYPTYHNLSTLP
jgi:hypothetical protein